MVALLTSYERFNAYFRVFQFKEVNVTCDYRKGDDATARRPTDSMKMPCQGGARSERHLEGGRIKGKIPAYLQ